MKKYTIETLSQINKRFLGTHYKLTQSDVDMANDYVELIENSRSENTPKVGDVVRYTNKYGEYFSTAHIEKIENGIVNICEQASVCVGKSNEKEEGFFCLSSGGTWTDINIEKFQYLGALEKRFWNFGHCGACADGGIDFYASVNVWECNVNEEPFSTKTHNKYYISYRKNSDDDYHFYVGKNGLSFSAYKTEEEVQAWIRTFRGVVIPRKYNSVVWTYKDEQHHVSPKEYEEINGIEDILLMNGRKRLCKRIYDDENFTVHTYFVWYWDDLETEDFYKRMSIQNKAIKQYELDYRETVNLFATKELRSKKVKPVKLF